MFDGMPNKNDKTTDDISKLFPCPVKTGGKRQNPFVPNVSEFSEVVLDQPQTNKILLKPTQPCFKGLYPDLSKIYIWPTFHPFGISLSVHRNPLYL